MRGFRNITYRTKLAVSMRVLQHYIANSVERDQKVYPVTVCVPQHYVQNNVQETQNDLRCECADEQHLQYNVQQWQNNVRCECACSEHYVAEQSRTTIEQHTLWMCALFNITYRQRTDNVQESQNNVRGECADQLYLQYNVQNSQNNVVCECAYYLTLHTRKQLQQY